MTEDSADGLPEDKVQKKDGLHEDALDKDSLAEDDVDYSTSDILEKEVVSPEEHERVVKQLSEEIVRKDEAIRALKEKHDLLLNTTVSQAEKITGLIERINKLNRQYADEKKQG